MPELTTHPAAPPETLPSPPVRRPTTNTVWGASPDDLHERFWASRRIQVIRRGSRQHPQSSAELFLLVQPDDLLLLDPSEIIRQVRWLNPPAMRIRVVDSNADPYTEQLQVGPDGSFLRIVRVYTATTRTTTQAWMTSKRHIAESWASARDSRDGKALILRKAAEHQPVPIQVHGRVFDRDDADQTDRFIKELVSAWPDPSRTIDGVFQFQPGVWVHESTLVDESVRFVPPVWIGASAVIEADDLCVGPDFVPDATPPKRPIRKINWDDLTAPEWRFVPPLGQRPLARATKRAFDIAFSSIVLLATSWLYPIIMLVIMLEDGAPAFFAHKRQTIGGREFPCYKFRTMRKDAEHLKAQLQAQNQADGPQFFIENDPRLLRCGGLLRKFQLDELPQFWNVLLGHMSVVGPRPSPDKENQYCPAWREARLSVRPGITGLWQVRRTREPQTDFQEWIKYDLEYVQHQSFRLDVWIILNTFKRLMGR